jgi:DNA-binding MarR family transcriptional regulator
MDRTTLTAILKPLERRGLIAITVDANDRRVRRLALRAKGATLIASAIPTWRKTHDALEKTLEDPTQLRTSLRTLE